MATFRPGRPGAGLKWLIQGRLGLDDSSGLEGSEWSSVEGIVLDSGLEYDLCCIYVKGGLGTYLETL